MAPKKRKRLSWPGRTDDDLREAINNGTYPVVPHRVVVWLFQKLWPEMRDDSYKDHSYKGD